jgi:hypothetical protein
MGARRESVVLREVLVEAMRTASQPLSTDQLRAIVFRSPVPGMSSVAYYQVYPQLRALERAGVCQRVYVRDHRAVYWRYTQDESFAAAVAELDVDT